MPIQVAFCHFLSFRMPFFGSQAETAAKVDTHGSSRGTKNSFRASLGVLQDALTFTHGQARGPLPFGSLDISLDEEILRHSGKKGSTFDLRWAITIIFKENSAYGHIREVFSIFQPKEVVLRLEDGNRRTFSPTRTDRHWKDSDQPNLPEL